jgi:hypothetical protein
MNERSQKLCLCDMATGNLKVSKNFRQTYVPYIDAHLLPDVMMVFEVCDANSWGALNFVA